MKKYVYQHHIRESFQIVKLTKEIKQKILKNNRLLMICLSLPWLGVLMFGTLAGFILEAIFACLVMGLIFGVVNLRGYMFNRAIRNDKYLAEVCIIEKKEKKWFLSKLMYYVTVDGNRFCVHQLEYDNYRVGAKILRITVNGKMQYYTEKFLGISLKDITNKMDA